MATITIAMASLPIPVFGNGFFLEKPHLPVNGDCVLKYHYFFQECDQGKAVWDFSHAIPKGESHYMQWINLGITKITYNCLNLPYEIHFADGHINRYTYTSDGRKLRVEYMISNTGVIDARDYGEFSSSPLPSRVNEVPNSAIEGTFNDTHDAVSLQTIMTKSYCGDLEYLNNEIERVDNDYGYWAGGRYHYYIKDYQGNVRAVIDEAGRLEEVNNYYPYGGLMGAAGSGVQPRKYGGKELDRENGLDWYDSQARHYPTITRFITMDPMAEKYYSASPYSYCHGNPINRIDPNGAEISLNKAIENKVCDAETISQYVSRLNAAFIGIATFNYDITNNMVIRSLSLPDVVITLTK